MQMLSACFLLYLFLLQHNDIDSDKHILQSTCLQQQFLLLQRLLVSVDWSACRHFILMETLDISIMLLEHDSPEHSKNTWLSATQVTPTFGTTCGVLAYRLVGCQTHWPGSVTTWPPMAASARALCTTALPALLSSRVAPHRPPLMSPSCAYTPLIQFGCSPQVTLLQLTGTSEPICVALLMNSSRTCMLFVI